MAGDACASAEGWPDDWLDAWGMCACVSCKCKDVALAICKAFLTRAAGIKCVWSATSSADQISAGTSLSNAFRSDASEYAYAKSATSSKPRPRICSASISGSRALASNARSAPAVSLEASTSAMIGENRHGGQWWLGNERVEDMDNACNVYPKKQVRASMSKVEGCLEQLSLWPQERDSIADHGGCVHFGRYVSRHERECVLASLVLAEVLLAQVINAMHRPRPQAVQKAEGRSASELYTACTAAGRLRTDLMRAVSQAGWPPPMLEYRSCWRRRLPQQPKPLGLWCRVGLAFPFRK